MSLLELKEVTVSFAFPDGRPALLALNQVNLSVAQGELVALVGPSGCGKTTALNVLAGQVVPTSGQVRLAGEPVQGILPSVGYISQADTLLPWRTVLDNVALAMELRGVPKSQRQETARALMKNMGLEGFEQSYPRELSGGMKKRAAIARVLAVDPAILMMDEPFAPLDAFTRQRLQDDILSLWENTGCTILYVTHDLTEAITLADRVVLMSARPGRVVREYPIDLPRPRRGAGAGHLAGAGGPAPPGGGPEMKRQKTLLSPGGWTALLLLLALGLWEATAAAGYVDPFFFSRPSLLWQEFWTMLHSGMLARHLSVTAQEAGLGLLLGGTLGTLAGLGLGLSPRVSRALMPLMTGLNGLPKLALGPLFIIWFGMGLSSKVLISALMVFFIFAFNLYTGVQSVDPALVGAVRLLGGTQGQILGKVIWPACLPWLLTSLRTGLGLSLSGAIVGEYLGSTRGMGWLLSAAGDVFNAQRVLCCVLILVILIILLDGVVRLLEARLLRWR